MNWPKSIAFGAVMAGTVTLAGASTASAQTFQSYRCSDGTQFIVGFYPYDTRAHMQIDGREVTLSKRLALSGARYSGGGISLQITKAGITIVKHVKRSQTACELM
jgi:membrane-bound inhibitor of C-type lysozyme